MSKPNRISIATITKIGVLTALAVALMFLEIPHFFTPFFWLKFDFADVPALIGGFAMGPLAGAVIVVLKIVITFFIKGTMTFGVGELANLVLSLSLVLPAALIYKYKKSLKRAIIGLVVGILCMVVMAPLLNYFVLIPIFIFVGGLPSEFIDENGGNALLSVRCGNSSYRN